MFGSAAARHLAATGAQVLAVGPVAGDPVPGSGDAVFSSHDDEARLTRLQDRDPRWAEVTARALAGYRDLEVASGIEFHHPVGCLIASRPGGDGRSPDPIPQLSARGLTHDLYQPGDRGWAERWPRIDFPATHAVAYEPGPAGYIRPKRLIAAQETLTTQFGGRLLTDTVVGVQALGDTDGYSVVTAAGHRVRTPNVVLATGAFTNFNDLLETPVELELKTEVVVLGEVDAADAEELRAYPTVKYLNDGDVLDAIYMTPPVDYPDGRTCIKMGANIVLDTNPTDLSTVQDWFRTDTDHDHLSLLEPALQALWPDVAFTSVRTKPCIITYTADRFPLIVERRPGLVVATAGNGGGAKGADAWGSMAAGLLRERLSRC